MARTADPEIKEALLDAALAYVVAHGVSALSLRPLARALDSSPRALLYHFGSKEDLVAHILARAGARQREIFTKLKAGDAGSRKACRAIWDVMSAPASEAAFRLFFEVYGLALQDRKRFAAFLKRVVRDWLSFIAEPLQRQGWSRTQAEAFATVLIAGYRGFMLDLCATRDRRRVNAAVDLWLEQITDS
ncbi:MAG: TetR/AcrR family transcriptional regulator [Candidatus Eremiobacteraeota bacterium]|nr:TetR/AcrR family transcriptional regulator [Candidatus Eremiobacteraeota bacterium]